MSFFQTVLETIFTIILFIFLGIWFTIKLAYFIATFLLLLPVRFCAYGIPFLLKFSFSCIGFLFGLSFDLLILLCDGLDVCRIWFIKFILYNIHLGDIFLCAIIDSIVAGIKYGGYVYNYIVNSWIVISCLRMMSESWRLTDLMWVAFKNEVYFLYVLSYDKSIVLWADVGNIAVLAFDKAYRNYETIKAVVDVAFENALKRFS